MLLDKPFAECTAQEKQSVDFTTVREELQLAIFSGGVVFCFVKLQ